MKNLQDLRINISIKIEFPKLLKKIDYKNRIGKAEKPIKEQRIFYLKNKEVRKYISTQTLPTIINHAAEIFLDTQLNHKDPITDTIEKQKEKTIQFQIWAHLNEPGIPEGDKKVGTITCKITRMKK